MSRLLTAMIFAGVLCAQPAAAPEPPKTARLSLTVIDSVTRFPIAGASVNLRLNADNVRSTNAAGAVEFVGLTPDSYWLSVSAEGYSFNDFPYRGSLTLQADEHRKLGLVPLDPLGSIGGIVLDNEGKPVSGGRVEAMLVEVPPGGPSIFGASIDGEGRYKITDLRRGKYVVGVASNSRLGVPASYYPNGDNFDQAARVEVAAGRESEHIDLRVRRARTRHIRGVVDGLSEKDEAILAVRSCEFQGIRDMFLSLLSAPVRPDRSFDMEVFSGDYCLDLQTFAPSEGSRFYARTRVGVTNRDVNNVRILALPPRELTGIVKLEEGSDLEMEGLVSLSSASAYVQGTPVQPDGSFRLTGVFPLDYRLSVPVRGGYVKSVKLGGAEMSDGYVNLESGVGPLLIEIAAARGRAKVKVNFGSAKPAQAPVVLRSTNSADSRVQIAYPNDQGELTLDRIAPGIYKVYAFEDKYTLMAEPEYLDRFQGTTVRIVDKEESSVELRLIPSAEIERVLATF